MLQAEEQGQKSYLQEPTASQVLSPLSTVAGTLHPSNGGDPLGMDQPLLLCGRSLGDPSRAYDGRLTQLAIFNASLTPTQVAAIYAAVSVVSSMTAGLFGQRQSRLSLVEERHKLTVRGGEPSLFGVFLMCEA